MSYALLSDDLLLQLESAGVSRDARHLHIEGIVHCATALSDGEIRVRLVRFCDAQDPDALAAELVDSGLWERTPDGYRVRDFLRSEGGHQRSREQVERDRAANRKRQEDYAERGRRHKQGDHSICTKSCPEKGTNGVSNGVANGAQSSPSLSGGKGKRGESESASALARTASSLGDEGHGFDGDADTPSCNTCGLLEGNQRHSFIPPEARRIEAVVTNRGGYINDSSYCPYDDDGSWSVQGTLGDVTVYCESTDGDPFTYGRLNDVMLQFPCAEAQANNIRRAATAWPSTEVEYYERSHCNVRTKTVGADLLSSLELIVDRFLKLHRQVMAA